MCGEAVRWHPRLQGVIYLVGKTSCKDEAELDPAFANLGPVDFAGPHSTKR